MYIIFPCVVGPLTTALVFKTKEMGLIPIPRTNFNNRWRTAMKKDVTGF